VNVAAEPARQASIAVRPVAGAAELRRFLRLPWRIYRDDPAWIPPLLSEQRKVLDRARHPFHQHADVEYFLAWRDREVVGRIAAIVNHRHNEFHEERCGFFGLFEATEPAAAAPLYAVAEQWLRERDMVAVRGPMNLSTNDELFSPGFLVDGFEHRPIVLMGHSPRWYAGQAEACGYRKAKDLLSYWIEGRVPERLATFGERLLQREGIRIRTLEMKNFEAELTRVIEIYNSAWERNWGFVPLTADELAALVKELRPIIRPTLVAFAEVKGETAGFGVALPDFNQVLARLNGRLLPFGVLKALWYARRIDAARVFILGVKPGYRRTGLTELLCLRLLQEGVAAGMRGAECSWILEDNWPMRRGLERMDARVYRTYRVFEKTL
jgi:hypothetical protein